MSKNILKEIREAIKAEKYSVAIGKCEEILREDKTNYMAYILLGAAYQNKDKNEAAKHLKAAIPYSVGPPTVALQGLSNCAPLGELPDIYKQLLELVPEKHEVYYEKIHSISSNPLVQTKCITILTDEVSNRSEKRREIALQYLAMIWIANNIQVDNSNAMYMEGLKLILQDKENPLHLNTAKVYLKMLYSSKDYENCTICACSLVEQYPDYIGAYEWICKIYCENHKKEISSLEKALKAPIEYYAQKLSELNENSNLAFLVKAIDIYAREQYVAARELLKKAQNIQPNYSVTLELLAFTEMQLGAYGMALKLWEQLGKQSTEYALCLSHQNNPDKLKTAVEYLESVKTNESNANTLARCYSKLQMREKLSELVMDDLTKAEFLMSLDEAINYINQESDLENDFAALILLGKLYYRKKNFPEALTAMLKATRLKPHRSECFLYLGKIYYETKDIVRARKCFEKCTNLNPLAEDAVSNLSSIYVEMNEENLNEALLQTTLLYLSTEDSIYIIYKLGLHYLSVGKWDDAIHSFRTALKFNVECGIYWESLGDAYNGRGSYNSAIRVFQKLLEMQPNNVYAKLQIPLIKTTIRMYPEAIEEFDELLKEHPDYLPGLKGAAEAHIGFAKNLKLEYRFGRCKVHFSIAISYLERAYFTYTKRDMVWLWRLFGNIYLEIAKLPKSLSNLMVSGEFLQKSEKTISLTREDLLKMSVRFYTCALALKQNTYLWYELSTAAYYCAIYLKDGEQDHLNLSIKACKMAINENSGRWQNWNLLGVINMHQSINNLPLAQHCFIQALNLDRKCYTAWTNLGVLYMISDEIKLANQAFQRAQQSSPVYAQSWIGQAMLAEILQIDGEALDLFRHCQQFDYHIESALGYAHWVCTVLTDKKLMEQPHYKHAIEAMHADVVALDAINWYVASEEDEASVAGLSFQGFLNMRHGLYNNALKAYEMAAKKAVERDHVRDSIYTNLGFLYLKMNRASEAINAFESVSNCEFKPLVGLALAHYKAGQLAESYSVYNSVLSMAKDGQGAPLIIAMASMVYAFHGENDTKTTLFQSLLIDDCPIQAYYCGCALGILHNDRNLTENLLSDLKKYEYHEEHCADISFLFAQYYLSQNDPRMGFIYLMSRVHIYPHNANLRQVLANFMIDNYMDSPMYQVPSSQMALSAITLSHSSKTRKNDCKEDAETLLTASKALMPVDKNLARKLVQKAIHLHPTNRKAWVSMLAF